MADFNVATNALGASIGQGLSAQPAAYQPAAYQPVDYAQLFENQIENQRLQADREYGLKKRELDQQRDIANRTAKTATERANIDKWYNEQQVQLAQQRLGQEQQQFTARLDFDKQTQAQNFGLSQAKLGYDVLGQAAALRGPDDYFAASNFSRGVAAQPGSATFLNALRDNTQLAGFGAQAGAPDAVSLNSLSAKMGGGAIMPGGGYASGGNGGVDALHSQIQQIGLAGAHKLGNGALEQLSPTEFGLLKGGLETAGPDGKAFDFATFLNQYKQSRIGQGAGSGYAAA